jgi:prepilin-type N-terminal cleavage/methylation domain-containing protein
MVSIQSKNLKAGFTLMEVLLVLGLLGMIFSMTAFVGIDSYRGSSFRNERDAFIGVLQRARDQSINNICLGGCTDSKKHGVYITSTDYTIFQGNSYATRDTSVDQVVKIDADIDIAPGGFTEVVFSQLSGDAATTPVMISGFSELMMTDSTFHQSIIRVSSFGQITWTN